MNNPYEDEPAYLTSPDYERLEGLKAKLELIQTKMTSLFEEYDELTKEKKYEHDINDDADANGLSVHDYMGTACDNLSDIIARVNHEMEDMAENYGKPDPDAAWEDRKYREGE